MTTLSETLLPDWFPERIKSLVQRQADNSCETIQLRVATDPRMTPVWNHFQHLDKKRRGRFINRFFNSVSLFYSQSVAAREYALKKHKIDNLRKRLARQIENIHKTAQQISKINPHLDRRAVKDGIGLIDLKLKCGLENPHIPGITFGARYEQVGDFKNRRTETSLEIYINRAVVTAFEEYFGKPFSRLALVVTMVILDKPTPAQSAEQMRDRARKRRIKRDRSAPKVS